MSTIAVSTVSTAGRQTKFESNRATREPVWVKRLVLGLSLSFFACFLLMPLIAVFVEALRKGVDVYWQALIDPDALSAIKLTFIAAFISVPLNLIFGVAAAWAIAKFEFRGKQLLITFIDLPFSVSPVIVGLMYVLVFGVNGWFGGLLQAWDLKIIFAIPGIVLATVFVTFPFVARELIPLMQAQGKRRRRSRHCTRCQRLADLLVCDPAQREVGTDLRRDSV